MIKAVAIAIAVALCFGAGYKYASYKKDAEYASALKTEIAVHNKELEAKNAELIDLRKSASADRARLERVLKSQAKQPIDLAECVRERDGLRELVKGGASLVVECREGLGWCRAQLGK